MSFVKTPIKGMRDILPNDMKLREYVINEIKKVYLNYGYDLIETPCVEHIENLTSKQGGENEKLIFKILKRGEKLEESVKEDNDLSDCGLRYDLTLPLSRFYANNINELNFPFKALQIGNVWRADRPQKGRYRQFTQCDIDILGEQSNLAEIDLITALSSLLNNFKCINYKIRINDRRILLAMALNSSFEIKDLDSLLISLDKLDKIGFNGVLNELIDLGFDKDKVENYLHLFNKDYIGSPLVFCGDKFNEYLEPSVIQNLEDIINTVKDTTNVNIYFDPTLVRGMSYYTGPIFEIESSDFNGSIGGGGRYDQMIEKFTNISVPACGFSIGFERLIAILIDKKFEIPQNIEKCAIIIDKNIDKKKFNGILKEANNLRNKNKIVKVIYRNKNAKHQKELLLKDNYTNIKEYFSE